MRFSRRLADLVRHFCTLCISTPETPLTYQRAHEYTHIPLCTLVRDTDIKSCLYVIAVEHRFCQIFKRVCYVAFGLIIIPTNAISADLITRFDVDWFGQFSDPDTPFRTFSQQLLTYQICLFHRSTARLCAPKNIEIPIIPLKRRLDCLVRTRCHEGIGFQSGLVFKLFLSL